MKQPPNFAPQAVRDVESAAAWRAVAEAADRISQHPLRSHRRPELLPDPYRFFAVKGFDYLLVYNAVREGAPVLRVLHMGQDLGLLLAELREKPDSPET